MSNDYKKIGIIGAGCYGTAIAQCFSSKTDRVLLITNAEEIEIDINHHHTNRLLEQADLNLNISCSRNISDIEDCDVLFVAVPSNAVLDVCQNIKENKIAAPVVLCSKGVDIKNARLMSYSMEAILGRDVVIFSGPSFANEIVRGLPFGVNIACKNRGLAEEIAERLSYDSCLIKPIDDYIGMQIAGAFKNILAIGCVPMSGLNLGNSGTARFIVDGIDEMIRLSLCMGGRKETFLELCGIGDIMLTCTSKQSRNVLFGEHIARGGNLSSWTGSLAEGVYASKIIPLFEKKYNLSLDVFGEIYKSIR